MARGVSARLLLRPGVAVRPSADRREARVDRSGRATYGDLPCSLRHHAPGERPGSGADHHSGAPDWTGALWSACRRAGGVCCRVRNSVRVLRQSREPRYPVPLLVRAVVLVLRERGQARPDGRLLRICACRDAGNLHQGSGIRFVRPAVPPYRPARMAGRDEGFVPAGCRRTVASPDLRLPRWCCLRSSTTSPSTSAAS